jgi:hypothetical protein
VPAVRSGTLVAWLRAWRAGLAAADDLVAAVTGEDEPHRVSGLADTPDGAVLGAALIALRAVPVEQVRLVLPVPGDARGLPGPGAFSTAAYTAGEGALAGATGLVPNLTTHGPEGDSTTSVCWRAYPIGAAVPDEVGLGEGEHDLNAALRDTVDALIALDVARWRPELAAAVAALRRPAADPALPACYPPRAQRLLAQADRLALILDLATADTPGGSITAHEADHRDTALRTLAAAVRRARLAAYHAPL